MLTGRNVGVNFEVSLKNRLFQKLKKNVATNMKVCHTFGFFLVFFICFTFLKVTAEKKMES